MIKKEKIKKIFRGREKEFLVCLLLIIVIISLVYFTKEVFKGQRGVWTGVYPKQVCLRSSCFEAEIAKTPQERQIGLMGRERLDENRGMLFIFENEGKYGFWMKNTLISLDIIWINNKGEIVYIKENALPCENNMKSEEGNNCPIYYPQNNSLYVLEINSGVNKEGNISVGEKVDFVY